MRGWVAVESATMGTATRNFSEVNIALFEDSAWQHFLPLTWLRGTFELTCGARPLLARWPQTHHLLVRPALRGVLAERVVLADANPAAGWVLVNGRALALNGVAGVTAPPPGVAWKQGETVIACGLKEPPSAALAETFLDPARAAEFGAGFAQEPTPHGIRLVEHPWQLALLNGEQLRRDLHRLEGHLAGHVYNGAHLVRQEHLCVEAEAVVKPGAVLDAENGPILIDRGAHIQPNAVIEGPCYVGPNAIVRPGAVLREGTTIGPWCKVGGEIEASILHSFSNKQHDGFLGHSYVGSWVNLGADTVTSDLKNTYGTIRVALNGIPVETGQRFIGSLIADHAKTGIGTILPTGCVLGAAANVFCEGTAPRFVPSFAWCTSAGLAPFRIDKAIEIARTVMARRKVELGNAESELLRHTATTAREIERAGW